MHLNYTTRLTIEIGVFVFIFSVFGLFFLGLWESEGDNLVEDLIEASTIQHHVQEILSENPDYFNNKEGLSYYQNVEDLPQQYQHYTETGIFNDRGEKQVLVGRRKNNSLYFIVFSSDISLYDNYDFFEIYELIRIIIFLALVSSFSAFLVYRMAKRTSAPILHLRDQLNQLDSTTDNIPVIVRNDELGELSLALNKMLARLNDAAEREREFTAFSSHELRTPLTIMQGNIDLLKNVGDDHSPIATRAISRLDGAIQRMTGISSSFLWLAREHSSHEDNIMPKFNKDDLESIIELTLENLPLSRKEKTYLDLENICWQARPDMLTIVIDNLIRNASEHGTQDIHIVARDSYLSISNNWDQLDKRKSGVGIGLKIVQRICKSNNWDISYIDGHSSFTATLKFSPTN